MESQTLDNMTPWLFIRIDSDKGLTQKCQVFNLQAVVQVIQP